MKHLSHSKVKYLLLVPSLTFISLSCYRHSSTFDLVGFEASKSDTAQAFLVNWDKDTIDDIYHL